MKERILFLVVIAALAILAESSVPTSTNTFLSDVDKARFKKFLEAELNLEDISSVYHAVSGFESMEEAVPKTKEICKILTKAIGDGKITPPETLFYAASTWKILKSCPPNEFPAAVVTKTLTDVIEKETSTISDLYYAVSGLMALSPKTVDAAKEKLAKKLQAEIKKEDSLSTLTYVFHIASELGTSGAFAFDRIVDAMVQADEVDGQYLQFEGGLSVTSFLVNGIYKLSASLDKKLPLTPLQTVKLANYLLSRRSVQTPKGVASLLSSVKSMATHKFEKPICITLLPGGMIVSKQKPLVNVKVCDILGKPLPQTVKVTASNATKIKDETTVFRNKVLQPTSSDKTLFALNFMESTPDWGFYKVAITADSFLNYITVKVLSEVYVDYFEIGTGDADQTTQPKLTRVAYPNKLAQTVEADSQQKLVARFILKDTNTKKAVKVQQAFVRLSSTSQNVKKGGHEIIFVAEPDVQNVYKFDMPIASAAANFGHQSGAYNFELIVGDTVLNNPFTWTLATVNLKFPETTSEVADKRSTSKQNLDLYAPKTEIKHMFREPEKRPAPFVSNLFTGLCLAPVLLLFIMWFKLGVNVSNFPFSASAVLFHVGLGSIFGLFGVFWLQLNMFVTLRYLLGLGVVTFLAGNKLLSHIAYKHKLSR